MDNQENRSNFRPMTLASLFLLFHKTHLNLINYERKPPDAEHTCTEADSPSQDGDPEFR